MNWYQKLYVSESVQKKKEKLIQKIEAGENPARLYLITLPAGEANQLELIPAADRRFWQRDRVCPMIVGLAMGKKEAFRLVLRITEDILKDTGEVNIRGYFSRAAEQ